MQTYPATNRTSSAILALVSCVLHAGSDEAVGPQQVSLETLISEEPKLALLAVKRWSVVNHLRMNLDLVNPLHMIAQLLQILYVTVTNFTYYKRVLGTGVARLG